MSEQLVLCAVSNRLVKAACPVTGCMWNSKKLGRCIANDVDSLVGFADSKGIPTDDIDRLEKQCVLRIQSTLLLYRYLAWLQSLFGDDLPDNLVKCAHALCNFQPLLDKYPFDCKTVKVKWTASLLAAAVDSKLYNKYLSLHTQYLPESQLQLHTLMCMTKANLKTLVVHRASALHIGQMHSHMNLRVKEL